MSGRRVLSSLIVAFAVVIAGCSASAPGGAAATSSTSSGAARQTQTSEGGQVTVVVDWAGPAGGAVFDVKLDTHSVDLDALDLADTTLANDRGETLTARPWAARVGGHHRAGPLEFDGDARAFFAGVKWIEMVIVGVGDLPERTLRWEVGP